MTTSKRACFIASETASACPFKELNHLIPADAEEGGLAKLFTARLDSGETVAVKRFHGARQLNEPLFLQNESMAKEEFQRMVELDGANGHAPRAWALGSCYDDNGNEHAAIAMQFIDGFTLEYALRAGLLASSARTSDKTRDVLQAGLHIAQALQACGGVAHRDLNPRNVMVSMNRWGSMERAVIIDFGQAVASSNPLVTPSAEPHRLATVSFGAPEVYAGPFYFMRNNSSTDVYSLGALLYYLRTKSIPFLHATTLDPTSIEGARAIVDEKREPVDIASELGASLRGIDRCLSEIARQCTAFDPRERPSIGSVVSKMEEALQQKQKRSARTLPEIAPAPEFKPAARDSPKPAAAADAPCLPNAPASAAMPHGANELLQLADDYFYGHGGRQHDKQLSLNCLMKAAEAGSAAAQFKLGKSLALGQHGTKSAREARRWLTQAQAQGHPGAAATLRALAV